MSGRAKIGSRYLDSHEPRDGRFLAKKFQELEAKIAVVRKPNVKAMWGPAPAVFVQDHVGFEYKRNFPVGSPAEGRHVFCQARPLGSLPLLRNTLPMTIVLACGDVTCVSDAKGRVPARYKRAKVEALSTPLSRRRPAWPFVCEW